MLVKQLEVHDTVVAAMQPSDRVDPANLGAEAKNRIAQRSSSMCESSVGTKLKAEIQVLMTNIEVNKNAGACCSR